jgi:colanic acid biosynthesis glycosyl transferase WcaI
MLVDSPILHADLAGRFVRIVGIDYAPDQTGNAPYTTLMAEAIAAGGAEVEVVTGVPHYPSWSVDPAYRRGLRWNESSGSVRLVRVRHWVPNPPRVVGRCVMEATYFGAALPTILSRRADATIAVTPALSGVAAALAGRRGSPVGALVQDLTGNAAAQSGTSGAGVGRAIARAEYRLLRACDLVGVVSQDFGTILQSQGVESDRIVDLPNCIHVTASTCSKREARRRLGWDENRFLAVYTGTIGRKQGLELLIDAARLLSTESNIEFVVVGAGGERPALEDLARGVTNLRFVDPVGAEEYPDVLAAADALLLTERPGVKEMSLPSKITSYAIAGRPIVAAVESDGITGRILLDRQAALVTPAGDAHALAASIRMIHESPPLAADLSNASARLKDPDLTIEASAVRSCDFATRLVGLSARGRGVADLAPAAAR